MICQSIDLVSPFAVGRRRELLCRAARALRRVVANLFSSMGGRDRLTVLSPRHRLTSGSTRGMPLGAAKVAEAGAVGVPSDTPICDAAFLASSSDLGWLATDAKAVLSLDGAEFARW